MVPHPTMTIGQGSEHITLEGNLICMSLSAQSIGYYLRVWKKPVWVDGCLEYRRNPTVVTVLFFINSLFKY